MVRSQKTIGGIVGVAVGNAPYKIGDRTLLLGVRKTYHVNSAKCIHLSVKWIRPPYTISP